MALHGPIGITMSDGSNKVIGYWEARRTVDLEDREQTSVYECAVRVNDDPPSEFTVEHCYSDGAIALMAKVFEKATDVSAVADIRSAPPLPPDVAEWMGSR